MAIGYFGLLTGLTLIVLLVIPLAIVAGLALSGKLGQSRRTNAPCVKCHGMTLPEARFCHNCGASLKPPPIAQ